MEARLKLKEASLFEVGGVAATAARDRQGNVVFKFDEQRCVRASLLPGCPCLSGLLRLRDMLLLPHDAAGIVQWKGDSQNVD